MSKFFGTAFSSTAFSRTAWLSVLAAATTVSGLASVVDRAAAQVASSALPAPQTSLDFGAAAVGQAPTPTTTTSPLEVAPPSAGPAAEVEMPATVLMDQVQSVSELSDVQPTDWAFQALQLLIERYGCIAGYPDGTYKGNRALTRYEFAAGVYACLQRMDELLKAAVDPLVKKEDLATLRKLQEQFAAELATLKGRVDTLEARTSELEANQFSTTTKLVGSVVFGQQGSISSSNLLPSNNENVTFSHRTRLLFVTSFTGQDKLITRLEAGNVVSPFSDVTNLAGLSYFSNTGNTFSLTLLSYEFPLTDKLRVVFGQDVIMEDTHPLHSPLAGLGTGAITTFADRTPLLRQPSYGGLGLKWSLAKDWMVGLMYSAGSSPDPGAGKGLFDGSYSASASINYLGPKFTAGLFYAHAYYSNPDNKNVTLLGGVGTRSLTNTFLRVPAGSTTVTGDSVTTDSVGLQASAQFTPHFGAHGWFGYVDANATHDNRHAELYTWALGVTFPDLFKQGSMGAITFGKPLSVSSTFGGKKDDKTPYLLEVMYKYSLNDNIFITPAIVGVFNPENTKDSIWMGVLRTEFKF